MERYTETCLDLLKDTEQACRNGDRTAVDLAEQLDQFVSDNTTALSVFLPHEPLDAVAESAALLPQLIRTDRNDALVEIARCHHRLEHLQGSEDLNTANIF